MERRLVNVVPTIEPMRPMDISTPMLKRVVPKTSGITEISKDTMIGPNLLPSDCKDMSGIRKGTTIIRRLIGRIAKRASLNFGRIPE